VIYSFYGLTLKSAVEIPALLAIPESTTSRGTGGPAVYFDVGRPEWAVQALAMDAENIPTWRSRESEEEPFRFALKAHGGGAFYQLMYGDGTRFLVDSSAARVWGEPGPGLSYEDVFVYLVGPVAGFILRRRGHIALHASAICIGERAVALMGPAGAGKSTTAAALALRGWPVCCEDVCALEEHGGVTTVLPGYPRICLWPDSVRLLFSNDDALPLIVAGWEKRYLALDGSRGKFAGRAAPLGVIYFLAPRSGDSSATCIRAFSQRQTALTMVQNTYMNWLLDRRQRAAEFNVVASLVSTVPCFEVVPSADPLDLPRTAMMIEAHALSLKN
jgi:hypothetical protein